MIRKSLLSLSLLVGLVSVLHAQDEFDALKASQTQLKGTARFVGMGGAFTALGGDASAVSLNPAGLGVYRSSEITGTLNLLNNSTKSTWDGVDGSDNNIFAHFNNFSVVLTIPGNDQVSSAFGFSFDRLKSFNRSGSISGRDQGSSLTDNIAYRTNGISENAILNNSAYSNGIPWISILAYDGGLILPKGSSAPNQWNSLLNMGETVRPSYNFTERGYIDQYNLSYGLNLSNFAYLGASIGWQSLDYSLISNYSEQFSNAGGMNLENKIYTTGSGFDVKLGAILRPTDFLRIGASYHTPIFYNMTDNYYASLSFDANTKGVRTTPDEGGYTKYRLQTPALYTFGIAAIWGKKGLLSFDYQYQDYTKMKLKNDEGNSFVYQDENTYIKNHMAGVSSYKVGVEYRVSPDVALRFGYNYIDPSTKSTAFRTITDGNYIRTDNEYFLDVNTQNFAAGVGYHYNNWNFDLAYLLNVQKQKFYPYDDASLTPASLTTRNSNIVFTVGVRY